MAKIVWVFRICDRVEDIVVCGTEHQVIFHDIAVESLRVTRNTLPFAYSEELHRHDRAWDNVTVVDGSCVLATTQGEYEMRTGDTVVVEAGALHAFYTKDTRATLHAMHWKKHR